MNFSFTEEQKMIIDTADSFLADISTSSAIRSAMETPLGYDKGIWTRICEEMAWPAMHIPEEFGGLGLGGVELVAVLEQMGRYQLCSPFLSSACMATNALLIAGESHQCAEYLPQICNGELTATLAYAGLNGGHDSSAITATIIKRDNNFVLNGNYRYVVDGDSSELLIVAVRDPKSVANEGVSLFCLSRDALGVKTKWLPTIDQTRKQAEITLTNVTLGADALMGAEGDGWHQLEKVLDLATIAVAAEQAGGAQQVLDMTVAYTKERQQFGRPIAGFQAVKHQAADMMVAAESAKSVVYYAACVAHEAIHGGPLAADLNEAASIAKAQCSDAFFTNASTAIQLHGGVGFTWEYDVHLYFKRAKSSEILLGNANYHRERLAKKLLDHG
ncbi:MAG: alkylation response protein AidB-like acyl-CoA dehydrogenase [Pseudomonadales bacterium]|jgi:alkylation response protein AidB-like acyl-CoA dehydrogenase